MMIDWYNSVENQDRAVFSNVIGSGIVNPIRNNKSSKKFGGGRL